VWFLFSSLRSIRPLTAFQFQAILHAERYIPVYRFSHVLALGLYGQEYYLCQRHQLATLTIVQCQALLHEGLSYRLHL
jgi:hypothetical protein